MDLWLLDSLRRLEQQLTKIETTTSSTLHLLNRLAILATLWAAVATLGVSSQASQELLAGAIRSALKL